MADPLSISASVLAVITAAIQSTNSLCAAVGRFKERNKTLKNLQDELEDLAKILSSLGQAVDTDAAILLLLEGPVERCSRICNEFEQSMSVFSGRSKKVGFLDWAKMEFRRGNINEFAETIGGYKATISIGLGIITMQTSKVSQKVLQEYNEMVEDTSYNLNIYLRRIDEKLAQLPGENTYPPAGDVDLQDEREVTKQCLRICEDARIYLESCANREPSLLPDSPPNDPTEDIVHQRFEAQQITRQALEDNRKSIAQTIVRLQERLAHLVVNGDPGDSTERKRLQEDLTISKQCLEVCQMGNEVSSQKIFRVGEVVADGESDQVVVTTLADLFDVKKALSTGNSAQLVGSMEGDNLQHLVTERYNSRFGTAAGSSDSGNASNAGSRSSHVYSPRGRPNEHAPGLSAKTYVPSSNETRKRVIGGTLE